MPLNMKIEVGFVGVGVWVCVYFLIRWANFSEIDIAIRMNEICCSKINDLSVIVVEWMPYHCLLNVRYFWFWHSKSDHFVRSDHFSVACTHHSFTIEPWWWATMRWVALKNTLNWSDSQIIERHQPVALNYLDHRFLTRCYCFVDRLLD